MKEKKMYENRVEKIYKILTDCQDKLIDENMQALTKKEKQQLNNMLMQHENELSVAIQSMDDELNIVKKIEEYYPADSTDANTASIGKLLLADAIIKESNWRNAPYNVLVEYYKDCVMTYQQLKKTN